jgi:UDP-N-acetyl-D-glucosamine dehydrogenase
MEDIEPQAILDRLESRTARVCVVGMGYVGLPLAIALARAGFKVFGRDGDPERIHRLRFGLSPFNHIADADVARVIDDGSLEIVDIRHEGRDPTVAQADAYLVCVPTPMDTDDAPDLGYVRAAMRHISMQVELQADQQCLVVLESTVYPGTTRHEVAPMFGSNTLVAHSPEREDPGNRKFNTCTIPKLVGGLGAAATAVATALYRTVIGDVRPVQNPEIAELAKCWENSFRLINIGAVNEFKSLCAIYGVDVEDVIDAAETKPFGFMAFRPGPGVGGHCIPVDPKYLAWAVRHFGKRARFIELAVEVNESQPELVASAVVRAMTMRNCPMSRASILLAGVAYKPGTEDTRESPANAVFDALERHGAARIDWTDPYVGTWRPGGRTPSNRQIIGDPMGWQRKYDAVVIVTDHGEFSPVEDIIRDSRTSVVVDTRGAMRRMRDRPDGLLVVLA